LAQTLASSDCVTESVANLSTLEHSYSTMAGIYVFLLLLSSMHMLEGSRKKMEEDAEILGPAGPDDAIEVGALSDLEQSVDSGEDHLQIDPEVRVDEDQNFSVADVSGTRRRCCGHRRRRYGQCKYDMAASHRRRRQCDCNSFVLGEKGSKFELSGHTIYACMGVSCNFKKRIEKGRTYSNGLSTEASSKFSSTVGASQGLFTAAVSAETGIDVKRYVTFEYSSKSTQTLDIRHRKGNICYSQVIGKAFNACGSRIGEWKGPLIVKPKCLGGIRRTKKF